MFMFFWGVSKEDLSKAAARLDAQASTQGHRKFGRSLPEAAVWEFSRQELKVWPAVRNKLQNSGLLLRNLN